MHVWGSIRVVRERRWKRKDEIQSWSASTLCRDFMEERLMMNSHVEITRLQMAAEQKILLDPQEWKHLEECRKCVDELSRAIHIRPRAVHIRRKAKAQHAA